MEANQELNRKILIRQYRFRWVECQLKSLQSCPRSEEHLDKVLNSLPQSLDETYERMLCNIDNNWIEDTRRILTLLCFAARPLTVLELIDGIAVETEGSIGLNSKKLLQDSNDIREICLGFIDIGYDADLIEIAYHKEDVMPTVRIAHFSVTRIPYFGMNSVPKGCILQPIQRHGSYRVLV